MHWRDLLAPASWNRRMALAALALVTVLAIIFYLLSLGWFRCTTVTISRQCTFEGIGDFPGGNYGGASLYSGAYDVSHDGLRVVGHGTVDNYPPTHDESRMAVGWTSPSGTIGFWNPGDPPGLDSLGYGSAPGDLLHHSFAGGISDDGRVVVGTVQQGGVQRPARWIATVVATLPPASDGNLPGEALDASQDGKIIVGYTCPFALLPKGDNWSVPRQAVRWRSWGRYSLMELPDVSTAPVCNASVAKAVSPSGEIIVGAVYDSTQAANSQVKYPALWWRLPPPTPPPPGPDFRLLILSDENGNVAPGEVVEISADGNVAVGTIGVYPNQRACYWSVSAPHIPPIKANVIPLLPGDCSSTATCVSVIGGLRIYGSRSWWGVTPDSCEYEENALGNNVGSFVWDINQGGQDLLDYMNTNGAVPAGWVIEQVQAVSADGMTIVGTGYNNGIYEGWVYRCTVTKTETTRWCKIRDLKPPPETPAPPPINPLIR